MKIALVGNGKMGKEVVKFAQQKGHELINVFDIDNKNEFTVENIQKADVIFEFTNPESAFENISKCLDADVPCVSGTSGWLDKMEEIKLRCQNENKTFFYASNFSLGVNVLFKINNVLAKIMKNYPAYDVSVNETHHIHKLDAPSGTAIKIANQIISEIDNKNNWKLDKGNKNDLIIKAEREGEVPGIHEIEYKSDIDTISIKHSAKNRLGLAQGAVLAAEFVKDKSGFFTMENLLNF
ncbi:MAG: 4-hydroxy-tetrahydrodipicolinate reductase [Bacteroidota bacterium]|nr:4-hydroxy-tetrahydrodipicolinate reductase [Bacteroidota bacterium]